MHTRLSHFATLPFWSQSSEQLCDHVLARLEQGFSTHIVTINAEMLLYAAVHPSAEQAIDACTIATVDSFAVWLWLRFFFRRNFPRITGVAFAEKLAVQAGQRGERVALIGGSSTIAVQQAQQYLEAQSARVTLAVRLEHTPREQEPVMSSLILEGLRSVKPTIILVGFGHGVQEVWLSKALPLVGYPAIGIGVGGAIDVWGGVARRAPATLQRLGLEWLWRLIQQPSRYRRILRATIGFPARCIWESLLY